MMKEYLATEFKKRKEANERYSTRAYARDLGIDASVLCKVLSGKRKINASMAFKLLKRLDIDPGLRTTLLLSTFPESQKYFSGKSHWVWLSDYEAQAPAPTTVVEAELTNQKPTS